MISRLELKQPRVFEQHVARIDPLSRVEEEGSGD